MLSEIVIYGIGGAACVLALMTVTSRDIFHSSVWLACLLLCIAGIYFYLDADFLGAVQILVYVGGIITLFVFAIKLTAKIGDKDIRQASRDTWAVVVLCLVFLGLMVMAIVNAQGGRPVTAPITVSISRLGHLLMADYVLAFEYISLILLAALVGAIVMGKAKK